MNEKTLESKLREIEQNLSWCNCCGERPEVVHCLGCATVCAGCSCKTVPLGKLETVLKKKHHNVKVWNNQTWYQIWSPEAVRKIGLPDECYILIEYETQKDMGVFSSLEEAYEECCRLQDIPGNECKEYDVIKLSNCFPDCINYYQMLNMLNKPVASAILAKKK
jgi:hypothetical protein